MCESNKGKQLFNSLWLLFKQVDGGDTYYISLQGFIVSSTRDVWDCKEVQLTNIHVQILGLSASSAKKIVTYIFIYTSQYVTV